MTIRETPYDTLGGVTVFFLLGGGVIGEFLGIIGGLIGGVLLAPGLYLLLRFVLAREKVVIDPERDSVLFGRRRGLHRESAEIPVSDITRLVYLDGGPEGLRDVLAIETLDGELHSFPPGAHRRDQKVWRMLREMTDGRIPNIQVREVKEESPW